MLVRQMTPRETLVEALGTVEQLTPYSTQPPSVKAGAAWPVMSRTEWENPCVTLGTWFVFVALPAGSTVATVEAGDDLLQPVADALWKVAHVVDAAPYQIPVEPGQQAVPVLRYTLEL